MWYLSISLRCRWQQGAFLQRITTKSLTTISADAHALTRISAYVEVWLKADIFAKFVFLRSSILLIAKGLRTRYNRHTYAFKIVRLNYDNVFSGIGEMLCKHIGLTVVIALSVGKIVVMISIFIDFPPFSFDHCFALLFEVFFYQRPQFSDIERWEFEMSNAYF